MPEPPLLVHFLLVVQIVVWIVILVELRRFLMHAKDALAVAREAKGYETVKAVLHKVRDAVRAAAKQGAMELDVHNDLASADDETWWRVTETLRDDGYEFRFPVHSTLKDKYAAPALRFTISWAQADRDGHA